MVRTLRTLMDGLIDYAGLFPPTAWSMQQAVEEYARRTVSEEAWMLGRFIVPFARLEEFESSAQSLLPGTWATSGYREMAGGELSRWHVSCILPSDLEEMEAAIEAVDAFNERHDDEANGLCRIDCFEIKATSPSFIDDALELIPSDILPHFEVPVLGSDCRGFVAALAGNDSAAKIRCGGVEASMIPSPAEVAAFLHACAASDVPFKATAGLHHPVRAEQNLTYDDNPPRGVMHGFLNVFLAAAFVRARMIDQAQTEQLLAETDPKAFAFTEQTASWNGLELDTVGVASSRESFALSYGSCSFKEPIEDLGALGLL